ncbi:hypothetical protein [Cylindrospermopsis raciborskii]|uniref:hypothetical protein n=1 Tax=Cylindrospermopsis raciborskii TaxID=77022 RepID=UPI001427D1A7|nr:hypothetical protein [Cylindrospermopsis raciborskii]
MIGITVWTVHLDLFLAVIALIIHHPVQVQRHIFGVKIIPESAWSKLPSNS